MAKVYGDIHRQLAIVKGTDPVATASAAQTGATFDRGVSATLGGDGCNSVAVLFYFGVWTDGTWTPDMEHSDDNSVWVTVPAAERAGAALTAVSSAATDQVIQGVSYLGTKRYVRGVLAETVNGTTGVVYACVYVGAGAEMNTSLQAAA